MGNAVFAFGGFDTDSMKVCEKCSVFLTSWAPLPPMHYARAGFTPCPFQGLLYLVSTDSSHGAVESFSSHTETFTVLSVSLPEDLLLECLSVAFEVDGELILLTERQQMARWKIEHEWHFRVSATDRECGSLHPPFIVETVAYIANAKGPKVEKWSLQTDRFI